MQSWADWQRVMGRGAGLGTGRKQWVRGAGLGLAGRGAAGRWQSGGARTARSSQARTAEQRWAGDRQEVVGHGAGWRPANRSGLGLTPAKMAGSTGARGAGTGRK